MPIILVIKKPSSKQLRVLKVTLKGEVKRARFEKFMETQILENTITFRDGHSSQDELYSQRGGKEGSSYIWIISPEKQETGINLAFVDNRRTPTEAIDPNIKNFNWMDLQRGLFEALDREPLARSSRSVKATTGPRSSGSPGS